jgi:hypothetical protein
VVKRAVRFLQHVKPRFEQSYALAAIGGGGAISGCVKRGRERSAHPAPDADTFGLRRGLYDLAGSRIDPSNHPSVIVGNDTFSLLAESRYHDENMS